jgi:hypothetical protein
MTFLVLLAVINGRSITQKKNGNNIQFDIDTFFRVIPRSEFYQGLQSFRSFARGLPEESDFQNVHYAEIFRGILAHGSIRGDTTKNEVNGSLWECYTQGWIHADLVGVDMIYTFPSPLHMIYASWRLIPQQMDCPFNSLLDLAIAVIQRFKPTQLRSQSSWCGFAFKHRPLEAKYQDEFYRSLFSITNGDTLISPEYACASGSNEGRIDFFIPSKRWGVEITRDGNRLAEHDARFGLSGSYGRWLIEGDMNDYILLDFRTTRPLLPHQGMSLQATFTGISSHSHNVTEIINLYHVVFLDNFASVYILNNCLDVAYRFALLSA